MLARPRVVVQWLGFSFSSPPPFFYFRGTGIGGGGRRARGGRGRGLTVNFCLMNSLNNLSTGQLTDCYLCSEFIVQVIHSLSMFCQVKEVFVS